MPSLQIRYSPRAQKDLFEIVEWYDSQSAEASSRFLKHLVSMTQKLRAEPERYAPLEKRPHIRKMRLRNFPYSVFYIFYPHADQILIVTIFHEKRSTISLYQRLK